MSGTIRNVIFSDYAVTFERTVRRRVGRGDVIVVGIIGLNSPVQTVADFIDVTAIPSTGQQSAMSGSGCRVVNIRDMRVFRRAPG
ncbi:MAG TPA: hypothetical protein VHZ55_16035 [Bryobacteraceae bacterium]|nr:hypothetical protein [Bryobacteraceae bacterium]